MNKLTIIGNLCKDPETRTTQSGKSVCTFNVAVNRRGNQQEADYFRVSAWNQTGEACSKYLTKGSKVAVVGNVSLNTYTTQNGENRSSMEVYAQDVEFLTRKADAPQNEASAKNQGYEEVGDESLPWE